LILNDSSNKALKHILFILSVLTIAKL